MGEQEPSGNTSSPAMTPSSLLAAALEPLINAWLRQDPETLARFAALEGRVVALHVEGLDLDLYFLPGADGIQVLGRYEGDPDTRLSGTPPQLAALALREPEDALFGGGLRVEGDTALGQQFRELLAAVDIDWEEQLARLTGDVVAHQAGEALRGAGRLLSRAAGTLRQDLTEYLQEELRLLPTRIETANFLDDVDRLRADVDRLDARVRRLHKRLETP